jgi:hypothetical protein
MPALPHVLASLAGRLWDNGAQIAPRVLDTLAAVTDFLVATGTAIDSDVAAASYLAAYLGSDDAKKAAGDLGIWPDLIPALPNPIDVGLVLGMSSQPQALVAAAVMFSRHAAVARAGDASGAAELKQAVSGATLEGSRNPDLAQMLFAKMANVTITTRPAPSSIDFLFSISIDLVGSTNAKTRIMKLAEGDQPRINQLNDRIYREFCRVERRFYEAAVGSGVARPIDPAKFFAVKGIGDEIWILCDASTADVRQVGYRLIDAALRVAVQSVRFLVTENEEGSSFDPNFDPGRIESIRSPIKVFIDLLSHASDLGHVRDDALVNDAVPSLLTTYHGRPPTPLEIVTVARRMSFSRYDPVGWGSYREFRTDYIGHEIDRFFRTTKSAIPGTVTIGASMVRQMDLVVKPPKESIKPTKEAIQAVFTNDGTPLQGGAPLDPVFARTRTLKEGELKGIGYAYDTFSLFTPRALNGLYVAMEHDECNSIPALPYHDTAEVISPNVVHDLVEEILDR